MAHTLLLTTAALPGALHRYVRGLALAAGLLLSSAAHAQEQARPADALAGSMGIGGRLDWATNEGNFHHVSAAIRGVGFRYVRVGALPECTGCDSRAQYYQNLRDLADQGNIKFCAVVDRWTSREALENFLQEMGPRVYALEGQNEAFHFGEGFAYANSLELQQMIWSVAKANGRNLQMYSWSLGGDAGNYDTMPSTDAYCDAGTIHPYHWFGDYTRGYNSAKASASLHQAWRAERNADGSWSHYKRSGFISAIRNKMISPSKPVVATEVGWATISLTDPAVSTSARLRFAPRVFLETFNAGIIRTFYYNIYETQGRGYSLTTGPNTSTLNDAGLAVKNLLALTADPGASFTPGSLNYSLSTASGMATQDDQEVTTTEIHHTLLQKRNGKFQLILWVDANSHDGAVADQSVTVTLNGLTASSVATYRPVQGTSVVQTFANTASFTVAVPDHPLIVEITPASSGGNPSPVQAAYGGTARTLPGTIQAEDYDTGGQGVAYSDSDGGNNGGAYRAAEAVDLQATTDAGGGQNVGWTADGEWLEYTVNVATAGVYDVKLRLASPSAGKQLRVKVGTTTLGTATVPNTSTWQTWQTVTLPGVSLSAGNSQVLRLEIIGGSFNLNWVQFESKGLADGVYTLTPACGPDVRLDVSNGLMADGTDVRTWTVNQHPAQEWLVQKQPDGTYRLSSAINNNYVLDVRAGSASSGNGTEVELYHWNGGANQRWLLNDVGNGYFELVPQSTPGYALDVEGASSSPTNAWLYQQYKNTAQQWRLTPVTSSRRTAATAAAGAHKPTAEPGTASQAASFWVFPNPNHGKATVSLTAEKDQRATVYLHNAQGLVSLFSVQAKAGLTEWAVPTTLAPGTYFCKTKLDGKDVSFTLQVQP
ncbi:RICIN domain-containing protein [Hymenobacter weizhouensis]|uniref:RICIN domain-containing protein n=1 Tax=Hymenobacter sp. YIM 151500-1 TaxID=2987689 RepID=UPI002227BCC7|nr:RICIN domain-containing protein [Hymenobacter sp. YIM 151500-1]UYZ62502.1 RICIN domain-containing protein [Hymenobacter sp. YIM 151500-1]